MNDDPAPHSKRADLRAGRKTRRKQQLALREAVFDMIASGYDYQVIAATLEISVATVRREFDRAIALRPAYPEAWYQRGNALQTAGRTLEAEASFRQALARFRTCLLDGIVPPEFLKEHIGISKDDVLSGVPETKQAVVPG